MRTALVYHLQEKMSWATLWRQQFSTRSEQMSKLENYRPKKKGLADSNCAVCMRVCVCVPTACMSVCICTKNMCCCSCCICTDRSARHEQTSLIIYQFSSYPHLINTAIFISSCSLLFWCRSYMGSNLQFTAICCQSNSWERSMFKMTVCCGCQASSEWN